MKLFSPILFFYLARLYGRNVLIFFFGIAAIVFLFDVIELLRRTAGKEEIGTALTLGLALLKLPEVIQIIFPFIILFAAMATLWQFSRRQELVIFRAAGLSAWRFTLPLVVMGGLIGLLNITVLHPAGTLLLKQYAQYEKEFFNKRSTLTSLTQDGFWLRQPHEKGTIILHAQSVSMPDWILKKPTVFILSEDNDFLRRMDASQGRLENGKWTFETATLNRPGALPERSALVSLATDLTSDDLEDSFAEADTIPLWKLQDYIGILQKAGFETGLLRVSYHKLLSQPLLYMAMIYLAASLTMRTGRQQNGFLLVLSGIGLGFLVFFSSSFLQALGATEQIPDFIAAWFPGVLTLMLGVSALMILEDG